MFGLFQKKKWVAVTMFKRGGEASVSSHIEKNFTKDEVLKKVAEWWDNYGTHLDDYDGIQVLFPFDRKGEENND